MNNVDLDWIERNFLPVIGFPAASPAGSIVNGDNAEKEGRKGRQKRNDILQIL